MKEMRMHEILLTARQTFIPMPSTRIHQHLPITPSYIEANYARYTTSSSCSSCQLRSQQIQPRSVNSNSDSDAFKEEPKQGTVCRAKISSASRVNVGLDPEDPNVVPCRSHLMMKRMTYIVGHNLYNHYMIIYNIARMIEEPFCSQTSCDLSIAFSIRTQHHGRVSSSESTGLPARMLGLAWLMLRKSDLYP